MEELLEKARKVAQEAEVYHIHHTDEPVLFEANRLKRIEHRETSGVALRIIKDGRIGFSSTTDLRDTSSLLTNALEMVPFGPPAKLELPSCRSFPPVEVYDPQVEALPVEAMVNAGQALIERIVAHTPDILCQVGISRGVTRVSILNSRGGQASYIKSHFSVYLEGTVVRGTDMLFVGDGKSSCRPLLDTEDIERSIVEQLELSRSLVPAPSGEVPVVFTPKGVAGVLMTPLLAALDGRRVLQRTSPLTGRLGERLLDERFSLWDEPTLPFASGSRMCDDEGVPTRKVSLIEEGRVASFLYDLQTAAEAGTESTGSARRSLGTLPAPAASVLVIAEGDTPYNDMIADVEDGLVVERLLGAGQGNILGGEFSANVLLGYRVKKGRIVGRVKDTLISGNVYRVFRELVAIGKEARWVGGYIKTPPIYCRGVSSSTAGLRGRL